MESGEFQFAPWVEVSVSDRGIHAEHGNFCHLSAFNLTISAQTADDASSDADFLSKMGIALREVKESRAALIKIRMGNLDHFHQTEERQLESEAGQLAAIFASIIMNMRLRLDEERRLGIKKNRLGR